MNMPDAYKNILEVVSGQVVFKQDNDFSLKIAISDNFDAAKDLNQEDLHNLSESKTAGMIILLFSKILSAQDI